MFCFYTSTERSRDICEFSWSRSVCNSNVITNTVTRRTPRVNTRISSGDRHLMIAFCNRGEDFVDLANKLRI